VAESKSHGGGIIKQHSIHFRAEFTFSEGKIKEYKKLLKEMSNLVEANEPETIDYQFYFDESETRCIVLETYRDPEAVFVHMVGIALNPVPPKIHEIFQITRFEVYGAVSKKLRKAMEGLNPKAYFLYTGFNR
jgi:quinol monooxygenase YgiN